MSLATAANVDAMAEIFRRISETDQELIGRLWCKEGQTTSRLRFEMSRLCFSNNVSTWTRVFKATSKDSKMVNGFAMLRFDDGRFADVEPVTFTPQGVNKELAKVY